MYYIHVLARVYMHVLVHNRKICGLAVVSEKLESALSINLYLSISFCWTTLILVLPSVLLPPASAAGTDKGPVVNSMS